MFRNMPLFFLRPWDLLRIETISGIGIDLNVSTNPAWANMAINVNVYRPTFAGLLSASRFYVERQLLSQTTDRYWPTAAAAKNASSVQIHGVERNGSSQSVKEIHRLPLPK